MLEAHSIETLKIAYLDVCNKSVVRGWRMTGQQLISTNRMEKNVFAGKHKPTAGQTTTIAMKQKAIGIHIPHCEMC